jgi:hypothetical protein
MLKNLKKDRKKDNEKSLRLHTLPHLAPKTTEPVVSLTFVTHPIIFAIFISWEENQNMSGLFLFL